MSDDTGMTPPAPAPAAGGPSSNAKLIALLGWIFAPLGVIAIFLDDYKADVWVRSHVIQAAALWLVGAVLSAISFGLGSLIVWVICIIMAIKAYNGGTVELPVIYGLVKSMIENVS
jgi:uncharacterized membrane protein